jgi:hypothetical protein
MRKRVRRERRRRWSSTFNQTKYRLNLHIRTRIFLRRNCRPRRRKSRKYFRTCIRWNRWNLLIHKVYNDKIWSSYKLKAGNGYSPYYFSFISFVNTSLPIAFSTLGASRVTGQDLSHMSYYYRGWGLQPICTEVANPTLPAPTPVGASTCTDYGSDKTYIDRVLSISLA